MAKTEKTEKPAPEGPLKQFLKLTGYEESDVIGSNTSTRTFVTGNGGKYELSPKGTRVRVLSGPNPPGREGGDES